MNLGVLVGLIWHMEESCVLEASTQIEMEIAHRDSVISQNVDTDTS